MQLALAQAERALWVSNPNPRVGCVIVGQGGRVLGQGHTQAAGSHHAEVMAIRDAQSQGQSIVGATAYVTLEPCAHHGRTPPCTEALVAAGLQRVVVAAGDPNPLVAGRGVAQLRAAGIQVDVGLMAHESKQLNVGFFSRMVRGRPWVRLKMAASIDGVTALPNGESQWITSPEARADGHAWRARACAVATGIGTVLSDDPRLDVRDVPTPRQPHLVLIDSRLQTPAEAKLWQPKREVWLYHANAQANAEAPPLSLASHVHACPNERGKVNLQEMLHDLGRRGVNELHLEAGAALNASFLREGWVDEVLIYLAPKWLGIGTGMSTYGPLTNVDQALPLHWLDTTPIGSDWRVRLSAHAQLPF
ncbi:MAG: bifunctional diaminohydroxyphosphoribosylaminopyrimidine [Pseudomonadota bacterium]